MKKLLSLLSLLLAFTVVLAACGTAEKEEAKNTDNTAEENDLYTQVKEAGVLKIGTEGTYAPYTFHDESGKLTGYDVEVAEEIAKRLGVKAEFMETQWDGMFAGLDAGRFDTVLNQVGINPEREAKYDFSKPYLESARVLIVHEDNNEIKSFADMKGKKSAQTLTSNHGELAKENGAELVGVEGFVQSVELIGQKRVDGTFNDKVSFLDYKKQHPDAPVKIVAEGGDPAVIGALFRKDSGQLVEEVNKSLQEMQEDGTLGKISIKWFGEDVSPK